MNRHAVRRAPRRGASIVEVLVALAILTLGAGAIFDQFTGVGKRSREEALRTQARWLAHQELNLLLAAPAADFAAWQVPEVPAPLASDISFAGQPTVKRRDDGALEIAVQVGWLVRENKFEPGRSVIARGVRRP